ncbi:MAG: DNA polymerase I [Chloroflexota bacterium]
MTDQHPLLVLIDGHALAFRAFHALADSGLRASTGEPTYAVFGFVSILLNAIESHHPKYVIVTFDVGRTFRDDLYADYKAGRAETPEEFHPQLERIQQLTQALNIPICTAEGFEADDVIGTLARQATQQNVETMIVTGDTDVLQLVDSHVKVLLANPYGRKTTTTLYGEDEVTERYKGLKPVQLTDLRGLKGDTSDNIPGVKGIGEAGAIALLKQFGTIESLYDRMEEAPNRYKKALTGQRDVALFSKKLATIVCDAPVALDLQAATLGDYDRANVIALFQELEFGATLVKRLPITGSSMEVVELPSTTGEAQQANMFDVPDTPTTPAQTTVSAPQQLAMFDAAQTKSGQTTALTSLSGLPAPTALGDYRGVQTDEAFQEVVTELAAAEGFAFDTEGTGLRPFENEMVGISLSVRSGSAWYIPFGHREGEQLPRQHVLNALRPFFADPNKPKYAHNAKFDIEVLLNAGVDVHGLTFDTILAAALLEKRKSLKDLAFYELKLSEPMIGIEELIGKGKKQITFAEVPIDRAIAYAAADADMTLRLFEALRPQLATVPKVEQIFQKLEMPLVPVLVRMEHAGIGLDMAYMQGLSQRLGDRLAELAQEIYAYNQGPFNINSGQQLSQVLFTKLGLPTAGLEKTKTGQYSLTASVLEGMQDKHQIIGLILQHRQLTKLKSTYVDALPALVNPDTNRVHTSYNQIGASTGRLSSNDPNLQNIPTRTDEGREIRRGFVAVPGCVFIAADYSQIELRVLAHITQDPNLVQAFQEGQDIHAATASQLFHTPIKEIDKNQRRLAKTVVFGVIYGISSFGLAQRTDLSRTEAQGLIDALFAQFPKVRDYIDQTLAEGRQEGFVHSLFGRRRYIPELRSSGPRRQAAEREAINAPIQATAADIMKIAMLRVDEALRQQQLRTRLLLQVHDELIFETPDDEIDTVVALVREQMESAYTLNVPLKVDVEMGPNWLEMKELTEAS